MKTDFPSCHESFEDPAMKFPRYWSRVTNESGGVVAKGWSENSQEDASANATSRLRRILDALGSGRSLEHYQYVIDNVICEEVIDRVEHSGVEIAVVSRNAYGSLVLNTTRLLIADVDVPPANLIDRIKGWFGFDAPTSEQRVLDSIRHWQRSHHATTVRVYRTAAGYRVLVSNRCFDGVDGSAMQLLEQLGSDPLYRRLCRSQSCFRARLSPKPWRIGVGKPPARFPFADEAAERGYQAWYDRYVTLAKRHSVCHYLETLGTATVDPVVAPLIDRHDGLACGDRPLA